MRALLISYLFADDAISGANRWRRMIKHLSRLGWTFDLVTQAPSARMTTGRDLGLDLPGLGRVGTAPDPGRIKMEAFGWCWGAWRRTRALIASAPYDLLISSSTPAASHFVAWWAARASRLPWVADFRDPFINGLVVAHARPGMVQLLRCAERAFFRRALLVVANTERARQNAREEHPRHEDKIVAIPNGADPDEFAGIAPLRGPEAFRMVHTGRFYEGRLPDPFLMALGQLRQRDPSLLEGLRVLFVGPFARRYSGAHDPALAADLAARCGVSDLVEAIGTVPHPEALGHLLGADALLLLHFLGRDVPFIPGKLYEYLQVGRPIFAIGDPQSEAGQILSASGLGTAVGSSDPAAITRALAVFLSRCRSSTAAPWRPQAEVIARYRSDRIAQTFDRMVRARLGCGSGGADASGALPARSLDPSALHPHASCHAGPP